MIPYKNLPRDKSQYVRQIILHQNRLRAKLPFILDYSPDKHFQSLASSAGSQKQKHLHSSISKHKLTNLGPFSSSQLQAQFNPTGYLQLALNTLNTGEYCIFNQEKPIQGSNQLLYRGYIRLITTEKPSYSGGSQVNITLYNRATLDKQLSNNYSKNNRILNKQLTNRQHNTSNNIIGMLLYLQCIKTSELQITPKQKQQKSTHAQSRNQSHQQMYQQQYQHRERNNRKRFSQLYTTIPQQYPYQHNILNNNNGNSRANRNSGSLAREYYGASQYQYGQGNIYRNRGNIYANTSKNNIMQTNTTKYTTGNIHNPQDIAHSANNMGMSNTSNGNNHYYNNRNSGNGSCGLRLQYLPRFSSESNIWKNVGQRNWNYKQLFNNRHSQYSGNSTNAFVYMDTSTPRAFYLTPNHKYDANTNINTTNGKMLANTFNTDRSYYYLS